MSGWEIFGLDRNGLVKRRRYHAYSDVLDSLGPYPYKRMPSLSAHIHPLAQSVDDQARTKLLWNDGVLEVDVPYVSALPELHPGWLDTLAALRLPEPVQYAGWRARSEREQREQWLAHICQRGLQQHPPLWNIQGEPYDEQTSVCQHYGLSRYTIPQFGLKAVYPTLTLPDWELIERDLFTFTVGFSHHMSVPGFAGVQAAVQLGPSPYDGLFLESDLPEQIVGMMMAAHEIYDLEIGLATGLDLQTDHMAALLCRILNDQVDNPAPRAKLIFPGPTVDYDLIIDLYDTGGMSGARFRHLLPEDIRLLVWETLNLDADGDASLRLKQISRFASLPFKHARKKRLSRKTTAHPLDKLPEQVNGSTNEGEEA